MIYVISSGSYSDYRIFDILEGPKEFTGTLNDLYQDFRATTGLDMPIPPGLSFEDHEKYWEDQQALRNRFDKSIEEQDPHLVGEVTRFGYWLVKEENFKLIIWEEINLEEA